MPDQIPTIRFHLSFRVVDLARSRDFYARLPGCKVLRERETWFDLDFFGHQVTMHEGSSSARGSGRPVLDHFGVVLERDRWTMLLEELRKMDAEFRVPPRIDDPDGPDARGKFVIVDPDGTGLEFKF